MQYVKLDGNNMKKKNFQNDTTTQCCCKNLGIVLLWEKIVTQQILTKKFRLDTFF
jgi:hypothetical protein